MYAGLEIGPRGDFWSLTLLWLVAAISYGLRNFNEVFFHDEFSIKFVLIISNYCVFPLFRSLLWSWTYL